MRRIWIVCVLVLSITTAAAVADKGANGPNWRNAPASTAKAKPKAHAKASVLFGDRHIEAQADTNRSGQAESFPFASPTTGTARTLHVYVAKRNRARRLIAGLYSNKKGRPGSLIASGSVRAKKGKWNTVNLHFRSSRRGSHIVRAGRIYWVALLGKGGSLAFRDRTTNMCRSATSVQRSLRLLPRSWKTARMWTSCPVSAYVAGIASSKRGGGSPAPQPKPAPTGPGSGGGSGGGTPPSGLVPCPLTHAAGAGPDSCWATHTGVQGSTGFTEAQIQANPAAAGFTVHNGDLVISSPNTVIDHVWIKGCIQIADGADNSVIKNSLVTSNGHNCSGDGAGGSAINTGQGSKIAKHTLIEDTTVDGGNQGYGSHTAGITMDGGTVLRVNLFGFTQGFISDSNTAQYPALFQDVYGHDYIGCTHDDGTWFNSSSYVTFEHGYIMMGDPGGNDCTTGALTGGSDYGPQDHVVFDFSYGEGDDGEDTHAGCGSTNSAYTNNALSTNNKDYGSGFEAKNAGNTWSGNYAVDNNGTSHGSVSAPQGGC